MLASGLQEGYVKPSPDNPEEMHFRSTPQEEQKDKGRILKKFWNTFLRNGPFALVLKKSHQGGRKNANKTLLIHNHRSIPL